MNKVNCNPKIFLTNSLTTGRRYIKMKNLEGQTFLNHAIHTPQSFAKEKLINLKPGYRLISDDESAYILLVLVRIGDYGLKNYVTSFGAASTLLDVINDYRYADNEKFTNLIAADYPRLLKDYYQYLEDEHLVDYISLLHLLKGQKYVEECYLLPDLYLRPLERDVFSSLFPVFKEEPDSQKTYQISDVYSCYGQYAEVVNLLNVIEENDYQTGDVEVLYTETIYENIIRGLCSARGVPFTLKSNHAKSTNYVSFIYDVLTYFKKDFKYELLENILINQGLDDVYLKEFYKTLNYPRYVIGFSKERSLEFVKAYRSDKDEEKNISHFLDLFEDLLKVVNQGLDYELLIKTANQYIDAKDEIDNLSNLLISFNDIAKLENDFNTKIDLILNYLDNLTYNEGDETNAISFSPISKSFTLRKHIFILGVNQTALLGNDIENAFIKDIDAYFNELGQDKKLHVSQYLRMVKVDNAKFYLAHSNPETISLSYSNFDKINLKDMTEGVRLLTDKEDHIKVDHPYREENQANVFTKSLDASATKPEANHDNGVINPIETIKVTEKSVKQEKVTPIEVKEKTFKLSPSAVRDLLECPFKYYYQKILGIPVVQYPGLDEAIWLEPNSKGTAFHKIMELYFGHFKNQKISTFDEKVFKDVFAIALKETEDTNPISNQKIHDYEVKDLEEMARTYINKLISENAFDQYHVLDTEYHLGDLDVRFPGKNELVLHGEIDRVDGYIDENKVLHLRIVDYKSGKEKNYRTNPHYQHVLYSYVLETGLNNKVKNDHVCLFDLNYNEVIVDKFIYAFAATSFELVYDRYQFESGSDDYNDVFAAINDIIVAYLNDEQNLFEKINDKFKEKYPKYKEKIKVNDAEPCKYCKYQKECFKRLEWGKKEWQKQSTK